MPPLAVHLFPLRREVVGTIGTGTARASRRGRGPSMLGRVPLPPAPITLRIAGVTKDSAGSALGGCTVSLYRTPSDELVQRVTSDGAGAYAFQPVNNGNGPYYVVAYKAGVPDVAGTSVNSLLGT